MTDNNQMNVSDVFAGLGHGLLSLVGFGEAFDPLGDLRSELSTAKDTLQTTVNTSALQLATSQSDLNKDLWTDIQTKSGGIQDSIKLYSTMTFNQIKQTNLFLSFIGISVIIIIFFMLVS
jgi:hypothetical protein